MNCLYAQGAGPRKQDTERPFNFASDSLLAQQVGAGELLERLREIMIAADMAEGLAHDEPNRVPEVLAVIHRNASQTYKELMRAIAFS